MVSLAQLKKAEITQEKLKNLFEAQPRDEKVSRLVNRIRSRVQDGRQRCFTNYRLYHAIDKAWETPLRQLTPTLAKALAEVIGKSTDQEHCKKLVESWGMSHLMVPEIDQKTGKPLATKKFDLPLFFRVDIPIMKSTVTIRWAKLTNDRNLSPYFKFEPLKSTKLNRARCEVLTDRVEAMATQYGYRDVAKQAILKVLLYGQQLQFIQEEWHSEKQLDAEGEVIITKEGLRYHLPHPTRTYYDLSYPLSSINSDSGSEYMGYWKIVKWKDVANNSRFWNNKRVGISSGDPISNNQHYFETVYPCVLKFPEVEKSGTGSNDREAGQYYTSSQEDNAVIITEHFEKIIPADYGLGNYSYPVWFRFVLASDDTVIYAAPLPGTPAIYWGGENDEAREINSSQALEALPFQDQISNLLSQILLCVKQNLANIIYYDTSVVNDEDIKRLENRGEAMLRGLNMVGVDMKKMRKADTSVKDAFYAHRFTQLNTVELVGALQTIVNLMERTLQMSAQETGGYASHEQSAEEVRNISQSTSNRVKFIGIPIDRGHDAWKRQLYDYLMAYGEEEIYAQLPASIPLTPEDLTVLGFSVEEEADEPNGKREVKAAKSALQLEYFAAQRDFDDRTNNQAVAGTMAQLLGVAMGNQAIMQSIGAAQAVQLLNMVLETMGLPRDFKLSPLAQDAAAPQIQQWVQQEMMKVLQSVQQLVQQSAGQVKEAISGEVAAAMEPLAQNTQTAMQTAEVAIQTAQKAIGDLNQLIQSAAQAEALIASNGNPANAILQQ